MIADELISILRKKIHVITNERFVTNGGGTSIDRFVGKHPLLKPELIVVNDQPYGFKRLKKELLSLENYPIYFEIELTKTEDDSVFIENFDLYTENKISISTQLDEIQKLNQKYAKSILVEHVKRINEPEHEIVVIFSKLNELFQTDYLEDDLEEGLILNEEINHIFNQYITNFLSFIKHFDDITSKNKKVSQIKFNESLF